MHTCSNKWLESCNNALILLLGCTCMCVCECHVGYNVCIFAYGQTGSGKTHTMSGSHPMTTEQRGINYRALDDLFELRDRRSDEVSLLGILS